MMLETKSFLLFIKKIIEKFFEIYLFKENKIFFDLRKISLQDGDYIYLYFLPKFLDEIKDALF